MPLGRPAVRTTVLSCAAAGSLLAVTPLAQSQARLEDDHWLEAAVRFNLDNLGESLDIDGDVMVAGAPGVGNEGAATVFRRIGGVWTEEQTLESSDVAPSQAFGHSVGVHGDVIVVGAFADSEAAQVAGAAYVYRHDGATWVEEVKLMASDAEIGDRLGRAVGIHGDVIVASAADRTIGFDDQAGAVYVFRWNGASWVEEDFLSRDPDQLDWFGYDVAVYENVVLAGAYGENGAGIDQGAAYVFRHDGADWNYEDTLWASDAEDGDWFGIAVSLGDGVACVGASREDELGNNAGAAYVFRDNAGSWVEEQKLLGSDTGGADFLGGSVAVDGDLAVVGATLDDEVGNNGGAAFLFRYTGNEWVEQAKLTGTEVNNGDGFGDDVVIQGHRAVVGVPSDDGSRGAVAVFDLDDLALDMQPDAVVSGASVSLWAGGGVPGTPAVLFIVDVNGIPFVHMLLYSAFDAAGQFNLSAPTTGVPAGTSVSLLMFGANRHSKVVSSGVATLTVQ